MNTLLQSTTAFLMLMGTLLYAQDEQVLTDYEGSGTKITMNTISCTATIVANPSKSGINTSDSVAMLEMEANHDEWAGFWVSMKTDNDADSTTVWADANTYRYIHVMVYKDRISNLKFKLEGSYSGTIEKYATNPENGTNTKTNEWEDIVIDFEEVNGFVPIWLVSPNWDDPNRETESSVVYVDNIVFNNDAEPYTSGGTRIKQVNNSTFELFPNPVINELHIRNVQDARIIISNILGEQIMQLFSTTDEIIIPADNFRKGLYIVTLIDNTGKSSGYRICKY